MRARLAGLAASLAALAACNPFDSVPRTKAGLWVETGVADGRPRPTASFCDHGHGILRQNASCTQWWTSRAPDGAFELAAVCFKRGVTTRIHRRIAGDFARAYTDDMTGVRQTPGLPDAPVSLHFAFRYQGACPPKVARQALK